MRSFFSGLILCLLAFSQIGCSGDAASENANAVVVSNSEGSTNSMTTSTPLPEFTDANEALAAGDKLLETSETDMAIAAYNQAVKLNPEFAEAFFKLGVAFSLIEARDAALIDAEEPTPDPKEKKTKEKKPDSVISFEKAVEAYKVMIAKDPNADAAHHNLGRSYNKLDEDEDAAKSLRQAVKLKPDDTEYQTELGAILIKLAKYAEAVGALKKALELDADNTKAEELLADAEAGRKRIGFSTVKKDDKKPGKSEDANANIETNDNKGTASGNTMRKLPPANKPN
ncbi:MAG: tetratricopeptide repeat protein [Saprospiraceae bacterium]|nr:tetratricopeptide repeat protein [Pyrinomonadaceae bacterium]